MEECLELQRRAIARGKGEKILRAWGRKQARYDCHGSFIFFISIQLHSFFPLYFLWLVWLYVLSYDSSSVLGFLGGYLAYFPCDDLSIARLCFSRCCASIVALFSSYLLGTYSSSLTYNQACGSKQEIWLWLFCLFHCILFCFLFCVLLLPPVLMSTWGELGIWI